MNVRHNTRTGSQAMNERDCIRTLTVWTCEFARQNLAAWPLSTTDSMNRSHENNNSIASHCAMVWWLQVLDQGPATRWDVAANNGTCRSRLSGSSGGLRKTCMCKTAQQWEARLTAIAAVVFTCSHGWHIHHCHLQTHTSTLHFNIPKHHQDTGTRIKASNTQARSTFSTYLHTWIVKRASPAASLWGSNFQVYLTLLPSKTCIRQPTSHEL